MSYWNNHEQEIITLVTYKVIQLGIYGSYCWLTQSSMTNLQNVANWGTPKKNIFFKELMLKVLITLGKHHLRIYISVNITNHVP